jgi:hypothetical protein
LRPNFPPRLGVRLLGVTVSSIDSGGQAERAQMAFALG